MTNELRQKIRMYAKNGMDISDLIEDVDIAGADLSRCIIKRLNRINQNISNCNFSYTKMGENNGKVTVMILQCKVRNCNFEGADFVGPVFLRSCDAQNCNFKNANLVNMDYEYTDFRGATFCNAIIRISTVGGLGCIFPVELFEQLTKGWRMKLKAEYL